MTYLFPRATAVSAVNGWAVCRVTNPLQDCCFSRICSSYDEDSECDVWNRAELFRIHCFRIDWRATESGIDLKRLGSHAYQAERYRCDLPLESSHVINQMILALERSVII